jgi:pimeloyl-ACP methyl ester carboxylesterase
VSDHGVERYVRPLEEVRSLMVHRAATGKNPFAFVDPRRAEQILDSLTSLDRDAWATAFMSVAGGLEERAVEHAAAGDDEGAREAWLAAYGYYRVARYPTTNSPKKLEAYGRYRHCFLQAGRYFSTPPERVEMPMDGMAGDRGHVVGYLSRPAGVEGATGLVVMWGGIDTFKEDLPLRSAPYLGAGLATLAIDMPGVGEAPVSGADDVRPMWDAVFAWIEAEADIDTDRVVALARSTGGYWATWLAHKYPERLRAAVNHGGPAHHAFTPAWIERAQHGEYPLELAETLAAAWGRSTLEEWVAYAPSISLLTQGILDGPSAPLLCVNGVDDSVFPIADHHLLLEHGSPKTVRIYPGGHMGWTPDTEPAISRWIMSHLR